MNRTIYGVRNHDDIFFLSLQGAESFVLENYPEYCMSKESAYDFMENMIYEDRVIHCEGCDECTTYESMDEYWIKAGCCDSWFHHEDCHAG